MQHTDLRVAAAMLRTLPYPESRCLLHTFAFKISFGYRWWEGLRGEFDNVVLQTCRWVPAWVNLGQVGLLASL